MKVSENCLQKWCAVYWLLMRRCKQPIKTAPSILTFECSLFHLRSLDSGSGSNSFKRDVLLRVPRPTSAEVASSSAKDGTVPPLGSLGTRLPSNYPICTALKIPSPFNQTMSFPISPTAFRSEPHLPHRRRKALL